MRASLIALALVVASAACGSDSGIMISVTTGDTVTEPVDELRFVIGLEEPGGGLLLRDDLDAEVLADVTNRDLAKRPFKLLIKDDGPEPPSTIIVGVVGLRGGQVVAFAGMPEPQTFMPGHLTRHDVVLEAAVPGTDYWDTSTGCLGWDQNVITAPNDLECDDCDDVTGVGCAMECETPQDCEDDRGVAPCGAWACNSGACELACPDCDDQDMDGYGVGSGCAGLDCDDADDTVFEGVRRDCYAGPANTDGIGTCRAGTETCLSGNFSPCSGEVTPSGEACNGEDDDCDGVIDNSLGTITCGIGECARTAAACAGNGSPATCIPGPAAIDDSSCDGLDNDCDGVIDEDCPCVLVTPAGDDTAAVSTDNITPFGTIQAAIDWAAADVSRPDVVCLAAGSTCGGTGVFNGPVTMKNGIQVNGRYEANTRTRCGSGTVTLIRTGDAEGVRFDSNIVSPTGLNGVRIDRASLATTAAITMDGAKNVVIADVEIINEPVVTNSYGIDMDSSEALITLSSIWGGAGTQETIAIRAVESVPIIRDNCRDYDAQGRCDTWCGNGTERSIRGRYNQGTGVTYGILLEDSPGAVIDRTGVCGVVSEVGATIRITGDATGTVVRRNLISAWGPTLDSDAILMDDCDGAAPWIVDNFQIWSEGRLATTNVSSVHASGNCHPIIDGNRQIIGGNEGGTVGTTGVLCDGGSRCVVVGNQDIQGSAANFPPTAIGVKCESGGCMRIANNVITGHSAVVATGLWLGESAALVENNDIDGGCGSTSATGVRAEDSSARVENNRIFAGTCNAGSVASGGYVGFDIYVEAGSNELDVHSNDIDGDGDTGACSSVGMRLSTLSAAPVNGAGIFRNNIIGAGRCGTKRVVEEADTTSDPRIFENNDLSPAGSPIALYRDENATELTDPTQVNGLLDMVVGSNISALPMFASFPGDLHLTSGSMCIGAGTAAGAPPVDMDGDPRDPATPDIGADEL